MAALSSLEPKDWLVLAGACGVLLAALVSSRHQRRLERFLVVHRKSADTYEALHYLLWEATQSLENGSTDVPAVPDTTGRAADLWCSPLARWVLSDWQEHFDDACAELETDLAIREDTWAALRATHMLFLEIARDEFWWTTGRVNGFLAMLQRRREMVRHRRAYHEDTPWLSTAVTRWLREQRAHRR
ncbi:MAG: hypothetical protein ACRDYU_08010 [Actinomycetes bacterium]